MEQGRRDAAIHARGTRLGRKLFAQLAVLGLVIGAFATLVTATGAGALDGGSKIPCENMNVENVSSARRGGVVAVCKDGPATVTAGSAFQYTLTVYAPSWEPDSATTTDYGHTYQITDELPAGVTHVSTVAPDIWDCSFSDPTVTCTTKTDVKRSDIDGGIIILNVTTDPSYGGGTVENCGTITKVRTGEDATTDHFGPWTSCVDTQVIREAQIKIEKTGPSALVVPGNVAYKVSATNIGPSNSDPVTFNDPLPAGTSLVNVSGSAWDCSASTPTQVNCTTLAGLTVNETESVDISLSVPESQAGAALQNCAHQDTSQTKANVAVNDQSCTTVAGENVTVKAAEAVTGLQPKFTG